MKQEELGKLEKLAGLEPSGIEEIKALENDLSLTEERALFDDFLSAMEVFGKEELKKQMGKWEQEANEDSFEAGESPIDLSNPEAIPHAVIKALFAPNPSYELSINAAMRGNGFKLSTPINGFEWKASPLQLKFEVIDGTALDYEIENNKSKLIQSGSIDFQNSSISFDFESHLPGCYYLRLFNEAHSILLSFFIKKHFLK